MMSWYPGIGLVAALALIGGCFQAPPPPARQVPAVAVRADTRTATAPAIRANRADPARERERVVLAWAEEAGPQTVATLASIALNDPDAGVRREAVYSLADAGATSDAALIGQSLADPDPHVRKAAVEALAWLGGDDSAGMLSVALSDADPQIRRAVVNALVDVGGPTAADLLRQAANDGDARVRQSASEVLEEVEAARP